MKSKTVIFPAARQAEVVEQEMAPPAPGELLMQSIVSHISTGTESFCYRGEFDPNTVWDGWVKYPFPPGYSNVGRVLEVGDGVTGFAPGDRVHSATGHRQFFTAAPERLRTIPADIDDEAAAWSTLATTTQTAVRRAGHEMGETVVVVGLGPLGQLTTQYLRTIGMRRILAIDPSQRRLDAALAHGATHGFLGSVADAGEFVREHTDGELADTAYDITGNYEVLPLALPLVKRFGTLLLLGDSPTPSRQLLTNDVLARQVRVVGTHSSMLPPEQAHWTLPRQIELFWEYVRRGQMRLADLITHRHSVEQAPGVYADLQVDRSETIGILFDWR